MTTWWWTCWSGRHEEEHGWLPVIFDVTHSRSAVTPGRRLRWSPRAGGRAGLCRHGGGLAGLFIESHPILGRPLRRVPSALPLEKLEGFLKQMKAIDDLVKGFEPSILRSDPGLG